MDIEIKYKNVFGEEISKQQAQASMEIYDQEQYIDGELKRIDSIENNQIVSGKYYLSPEEDLQSVVSQFKSIWKDGYFYLDKQLIGDYTLRTWEVYQGLNKVYKGQTVYDIQGREIAEQFLDVNTLQVLYTIKTHYLSSFGEFDNSDDVLNYGILRFYYNFPSIGTFKVEVNLPGFDHKDYPISDRQNILTHPMIKQVFSWNEEVYYHNSHPLIPA